MKKIFIISVLSITLFGCKKNEDNPTTPSSSLSGIYIAGNENNIPKYWKNSVGKTLPLSPTMIYGLASAIAIGNGNVYLAGEEGNNTISQRAVYWRNDTVYSLHTSSSLASSANCIAIAGKDVYVGGDETEAGNTTGSTAKIWKNGTGISLSDGLKVASVLAITVAGADVYAAGFENVGSTIFSRRPKYWKNGVAVSIGTNNNEGFLTGIVVSGSDVYVTGYEVNDSGVAVAKFWKNGVENILSSGPVNHYGFCLMLSGSDVYVGGYERPQNIFYKAKYWKNNAAGENILQATGSQDAIVSAGFINGNDVYFAGTVNTPTNVLYKARIWKNGVATDVTDGTKLVRISSIFVVQ